MCSALPQLRRIAFCPLLTGPSRILVRAARRRRERRSFCPDRSNDAISFSWNSGGVGTPCGAPLNEKQRHDDPDAIGGARPGAGAAEAEEAFRLHYGRILSYLMSRTDKDLAEEVTQQVFVEATRAFVVSGESPSNVLAWLYTVASRRLTDELRRRVRMRNRLADLQAVAGAESKDQDYGRLVAQSLARSVGALTPEDRMLVRGRLLEGRSFSELAVKLAISEPACKMRFSRAMRLVRSSLEADGLP